MLCLRRWLPPSLLGLLAPSQLPVALLRFLPRVSPAPTLQPPVWSGLWPNKKALCSLHLKSFSIAGDERPLERGREIMVRIRLSHRQEERGSSIFRESALRYLEATLSTTTCRSCNYTGHEEPRSQMKEAEQWRIWKLCPANYRFHPLSQQATPAP